MFEPPTPLGTPLTSFKLSFSTGNFKACREGKEVYLVVNVKFKIVTHTKSTVPKFRVSCYIQSLSLSCNYSEARKCVLGLHRPTTALRGKVSHSVCEITLYQTNMRTAVVQWLRSCATNRKEAGSIPDGVIGTFHRRIPSDRTMALGST